MALKDYENCSGYFSTLFLIAFSSILGLTNQLGAKQNSLAKTNFDNLNIKLNEK